MVRYVRSEIFPTAKESYEYTKRGVVVSNLLDFLEIDVEEISRELNINYCGQLTASQSLIEISRRQ